VGLVHQGYKHHEGATIRAALVDHFIEATAAWVSISAEARSAMVRDDNAFDALVAALTARAWISGLARPIPDELEAAAATEGWIALPLPGSLADLAAVQ
jgi:predicted RNase H-like nuclease